MEDRKSRFVRARAAILRTIVHRPPPPPPLVEGNSKTPLVVGEESLYRSTRTRPYYFRRCKTVRPTKIESLPNELLSDILVRLPADYLYDTARLVCRMWYHIIQSDAFVSKQFQHSTYGLLLSTNSWHGDHHPIFMTATQGRVEISEFSYKCRTTLFMGCGGLAIDAVYHKPNHATMYIVNPATKKFLLVLPRLPTGRPHTFLCGIAFAASSMKYKLVLPYEDMNSREMFLAILTIGVDNSWRNIEVQHLPYHVKVYFRFHPITTGGFIHWTRMESSILTLDVETEIITPREIPPRSRGFTGLLPRPSYFTGLHYLSTGTFLSVLVAFEDFSWEIWGMNSETGEWRKVLPDIKLAGLLHQLASTGKNEALRDLLSSGGRDGVLVPLGWVKYPEVLALGFSHESRICILYNLDRHEINSTELPHVCSLYSKFVHKNCMIGLG